MLVGQEEITLLFDQDDVVRSRADMSACSLFFLSRFSTNDFTFETEVNTSDLSGERMPRSLAIAPVAQFGSDG